MTNLIQHIQYRRTKSQFKQITAAAQHLGSITIIKQQLIAWFRRLAGANMG